MFTVSAQSFSCTELPAEVHAPRERLHGPIGYLWLTEEGDTVSCVHSETGTEHEYYVYPIR